MRWCAAARVTSCVVLLAACATQQPIAAGIPRVVDRLVIAPYAMHEECMRLAPGDRLDWRYESSQPLAFNIHYHEANAVLSPVVRDDSTGDSGTFEARQGEDYCLMWEAGAPGAIIGYRILLRRSGP
jgi:hypothetical protein